MLILYFLISFIKNPTKVYLNLEKPNNFIIHTGVTLKNNLKEVRFDFRAFNDNRDYMTTFESRRNISEVFPDLDTRLLSSKYLGKEIKFKYSKELYWGTSNYSMEEIISMEKKLHKKYILGLYDCRHYANELCKLSVNKRIPIWNLKSLL
tara:strand:- start:4025 stop:4474 length:450 start_codon:yes stop_codon:yes gene_type:complete